MPFLRTFLDDDSFLPQSANRGRTSLFNSLRHARHHRRHSAPTTQVSTHPCSNPATHLKPIYIYPGLLRIVREKAIALDNQCPAVHYKCRKCDEESSPAQPKPQCEHDVCCPVCLDKFHGKDLVRKLPCDSNHMFHSKCILDWFAFQQRCPLCNEYVSNSLQVCVPCQPDSPALPLDLPRRFAEDRRFIGQRNLRFLGVDINLARFSREITNAPVDRPSRADIGDLFCPSTSSHGDQQSSSQVIRHRQNDKDSSEQSTASGTGTATEKQKSHGPRIYSYIVHDNVRMEMNTRIPV
eukprot:gb/GEZJ01004689.1/.p1 GENE.gb/GEZJ01004689.1/~~gb/GEZJ01004689.1/.p1  ORF type:complete len:295 (-),score=18.46 gb/GEZJ01004689.1/:900-1784(-)